MPPGRRARALRSVACASQPRWQCAGSCGSAFCGSTPCPIPCQDAATGQHKVRGGSGMVPGGAGPSYMAAESHLAAVSYCPGAANAVRLPRRRAVASREGGARLFRDLRGARVSGALSVLTSRQDHGPREREMEQAAASPNLLPCCTQSDDIRSSITHTHAIGACVRSKEPAVVRSPRPAVP